MNYGTVRAVSTTYACVANDFTLECDATAAPFTVTLPTLNLEPGRVIRVIKKDAGANAITIAAPGGYTIESNLSDATVNAKDDQITLQLGTGTIWYGVEQAEKLLNVQATTPGTAQTGNTAISGKSIANTGFKATCNTAGLEIVSAADADNTIVATADGTTATVALVSPSGTKSARLTANDTSGALAIQAIQVVGAQAAAEADLTVVAGADFDGADTVGKAAILAAVAAVDTKVNNLLAKLRTHGLIAT